MGQNGRNKEGIQRHNGINEALNTVMTDFRSANYSTIKEASSLLTRGERVEELTFVSRQ